MNENVFLTNMGNRIAQHRKSINITQEQLAEKMNVSIQTISCIELGKKGIRPENLANLCICMGVSPEYILLGKRTEKQMDEVTSKLSMLSQDEYALVKNLVEVLYRNHETAK